MDRILDVNYVPTFKDILKSTNEETQINEIPISTKHSFSLLDVHKRHNLNEIHTALYLYTKKEGKTRFLIYSVDSMNFLTEEGTDKCTEHFKSLGRYIGVDVLLAFTNIENFKPKFLELRKQNLIKARDVYSFFSDQRKIFKKFLQPKLKMIFLTVQDAKDEKLKTGIVDFLNGLVVEALVKSSSFYDF